MMLLNVLLFLWFTRQFPVTERHQLELTQYTVKRLPLDDSVTLCSQRKRSDGLPEDIDIPKKTMGSNCKRVGYHFHTWIGRDGNDWLDLLFEESKHLVSVP